MSATEYSVDLRDIRFVLFEQLKIQEALRGIPAFQDYDQDFYNSILEEAYRIALEVIAPINVPGDREGCHFDGKGNVTAPKGYKEAWDVLAQGGWIGLTASQEHGGMGLPHAVGVPVGEIRTGACVALSIYCGLTEGVSNLLTQYSPDWMKPLYLPRLNGGTWAGTMLLTEAGAGSAVGDNRCKAFPTETPGVYRLEGEKIFISGGDQNFTENIIHIVLARVPNAPSGTKGLSIFAVPKYCVNEDGSLGEWNDIKVTGIEEKMGLHGSATCTLALGADSTCIGYRLGDENQGMKIMFELMNEARLMVGIQGLSAAAPAYQGALAYARERIQGTDVAEFKNADAPRVPIVRHPDVRRMLMTMKVLVETMRSLIYTTAFEGDLSRHEQNPKVRDRANEHVDLFTPICKAHCSDMGFDVTRLAIQVLGGYGYCQEYPTEQYMRDCKIGSIYEGTNGIQAIDLLGRKLQMKGGMLFMNWFQEVTGELKAAKGKGFDAEVAELEKAKETLGAAAMHLAQLSFQKKLHGAMLQASPFLNLFGIVVLGLHALRQALAANECLTAGTSEEGFYRGKVLNLKFYVANILPQAIALSKSIRSNDESCLDPTLFPEE